VFARSVERAFDASCFGEVGFASAGAEARAFLSTGVTSGRPFGRGTIPSWFRAVGADVDCRVLVAVERGAAGVAVVGALSKGEPVLDYPAARAELRGGEEAIGEDEGGAVPLALVGELAAELAQASVADR
jgi:hypothetical protein